MSARDLPEPRYAKAADGVSIAYQAFGHGRRDIVWLPGNATQIDVQWEHPSFADLMARLAESGRVILVDRRGVGLSDRVDIDALPPVEVLVSDLLAVLDEVRSKDTVLLGQDEGAHTAVLFAATHPDRVRGLILYAPRPSMLATPEHPWGGTGEEWEEWLAWAADHWGSRESIVSDMQELMPSLLDDPTAIAWGAKVQRAAASPHAAIALFRISMQLDVSAILPTVRTPTLVIHPTGDPLIPVAAGRAVADLMPDATFVEMPGEDHFFNSGGSDPAIQAIRAFLAGPRTAVDASRRLATVLFTDIVDATARAAELGDAGWRDALSAHNAMVHRELDRFSGTLVDTAGDGHFATFDGPARAVRCARSVAGLAGDLGLRLRAGVHTGEVELIDGKIGGIAVHIGARIGALAGPGEVLVSSTVRDLVAGSGLVFEDAGEHELKGVPDRWRLYRVVA